jgi:hypothetical protein
MFHKDNLVQVASYCYRRYSRKLRWDGHVMGTLGGAENSQGNVHF